MGVNSTMVIRLGLNIRTNYMIYMKEMDFIPWYSPSNANFCLCRRLCMAIFTGTMLKNRNGSWFQALIVHLLVVLTRRSPGRTIFTSLVCWQTFIHIYQHRFTICSFDSSASWTWLHLFVIRWWVHFPKPREVPSLQGETFLKHNS